MPKVGLLFKVQTRGLETWMASIPWTSVSVLYFFSFTRPAHIAGHIQKIKYRNNCRGNEHFFVFHFLYFSGPIAVGLRALVAIQYNKSIITTLRSELVGLRGTRPPIIFFLFFIFAVDLSTP